MRLIAERAGIVTYIVEYQLAPEAKYPVQIDEIEYAVRWLFDNAEHLTRAAACGAPLLTQPSLACPAPASTHSARKMPGFCDGIGSAT